MIGRGSGANPFVVGDELRLLTGKTSAPAVVKHATFFGVHLEIETTVRGRRVKRQEFVPKGQYATRIRVLKVASSERRAS